MPRATRQGRWKYISGEKGANRVRVFVHHSGKLFAEYRRKGRKVRESLGHSDRTRAKLQADELAVALRQPDRAESVTLDTLFDSYERTVTPTKSLSTQGHDKAAIAHFRRILGEQRFAHDLTVRDVARFEVERRRLGDLRPRKKADRGKHFPLKRRTIAYDLRLLKGILTWGVTAGFLERNPLATLKITDDGTPHRPVFTEPQYRALLATADSFAWQFGCLLVLAHETGHRLNAILSLQWRDIDFVAGRITWRGEADKIGNEHVTPMTDTARRAFEDARRQAPGIGDTPVLPGVKATTRQVGTDLARDWVQKAQLLAKLPVVKGRGWHAFRRNFASELRHVGLRDLCDLGGWKDPMTVVKCYQRPSEEAMRAAQAARRVLEG
ncbi:MAG: tyrosine-type recombinase/integrase [Gemmatimonadales bacterium]